MNQLTNPNFFSKQDFEKFRSIKLKSNRVRDQSEDDIKFVKSLFAKSNYWANNSVPSYLIVEPDNRWQNSGFLKRYSWPRIYRASDKNKMIYFTFGFEATGKLVFKLDCQRGQKMAKHLNPIQVERFDALVKNTATYYNVINEDDLNNYNWTSLIDTSKYFLEQHLGLYSEAIEYVWSERVPLISKKGRPMFVPIPDIPDEFISHSPSFLSNNYKSNPNFEIIHKASKQLGNLGEDFILMIERERLKHLLSEKDFPKKMIDGDGYDILSLDDNGEELFIEVKTTTGSKTTPFYISSNELAFLEQTKNSFIYRVFNYDPLENTGEIFIMSYSDIKKLNVQSSEYKIYLK